mgnify:CR=1 FL=1
MTRPLAVVTGASGGIGAATARALAAADVPSAVAVVCVGDDDAVNLEIALLARQLSPQVRVVARKAAVAV